MLLVMWIAQGKKEKKKPKPPHTWKITFHFFIWFSVSGELYYHYVSSCAWFNSSGSRVADADLRYYSQLSLSQLRSEIHLSLYITRTDTNRQNLAVIHKDKAWKNRIQEETRLIALIHKILLFKVLVFFKKRVTSNITANMNFIVHRNY